jgi:hypothetical protein
MQSKNIEIKINSNYDKETKITHNIYSLKFMSFCRAILNLIFLALYFKYQPESEGHLLLVGLVGKRYNFVGETYCCSCVWVSGEHHYTSNSNNNIATEDSGN